MNINTNFLNKLANKFNSLNQSSVDDLFLSSSYLYYTTSTTKKSTVRETNSEKITNFLKENFEKLLIYQYEIKDPYLYKSKIVFLQNNVFVKYIFCADNKIWFVVEFDENIKEDLSAFYSFIMRIYIKDLQSAEYISYYENIKKFIENFEKIKKKSFEFFENTSNIQITTKRVEDVLSYKECHLGYGNLRRPIPYQRILMSKIFFQSIAPSIKYNSLYSSIANSKTKKERDNLKADLSNYLFTITGNSRRSGTSILEALKSGKTSINSFVVVDLDGKDFKPLVEYESNKVLSVIEKNTIAQEIKKVLFDELDYVCAAFISPGFDGVKLIIKIDYEKIAFPTGLKVENVVKDYKKVVTFVYKRIEGEINKLVEAKKLNYKVSIDLGCADISKGHYEFYDPSFLIRNLHEVKTFDEQYVPESKKIKEVDSLYNQKKSYELDIKNLKPVKENFLAEEYKRKLDCYGLLTVEDIEKISFSDEDLEKVRGLIDILPQKFEDEGDKIGYEVKRDLHWRILYATNNFASPLLCEKYEQDIYGHIKSFSYERLEFLNLKTCLLSIKKYFKNKLSKNMDVYYKFQKVVCSKFAYYDVTKADKKKNDLDYFKIEKEKVKQNSLELNTPFQTEAYTIPETIWFEFIDKLPENLEDLKISNQDYLDFYELKVAKTEGDYKRLENAINKTKDQQVKDKLSVSLVKMEEYIGGMKEKNFLFENKSLTNFMKAIYAIGGKKVWGYFSKKFNKLVNSPVFEPCYLEEFSIKRIYDYIEFYCILFLEDDLMYSKLLGSINTIYCVRYSANNLVAFDGTFYKTKVMYDTEYSEPDGLVEVPNNADIKSYMMVIDTEFTASSTDENSLNSSYDQCLKPVEKDEFGNYKMFNFLSAEKIEEYRQKIKKYRVGQSLILTTQSKVVGINDGKIYSNFLDGFESYEEFLPFDTQWDGKYSLAMKDFNYKWIIEELIELRASNDNKEDKKDKINKLADQLVEFIKDKTSKADSPYKFGGYRKFVLFGHAIDTDIHKVCKAGSVFYELFSLIASAGYFNTEFKVLKNVSKKGILPILIKKDNYLYIMQVEFRESVRLGGVSYSYDKFAEVVNIPVPYKNLFDDKPDDPPEYRTRKARMLEMAVIRREDFINYALGDLRSDDFYLNWAYKMRETCYQTCRKLGENYFGEKDNRENGIIKSYEPNIELGEIAYKLGVRYFSENFRLGMTIGPTIETFVITVMKTLMRVELEIEYMFKGHQPSESLQEKGMNTLKNEKAYKELEDLYKRGFEYFDIRYFDSDFKHYTDYEKRIDIQMSKEVKNETYIKELMLKRLEQFEDGSLSFRWFKNRTDNMKDILVERTFRSVYGKNCVKEMLKNDDIAKSPDAVVGFLTKTLGGRAFNNKPLNHHERGVLIDMDLQSCYASAMSMLVYFLGGSFEIQKTGMSRQLKLSEQKKGAIKLKDFIKNEHIYPRFWFAYIHMDTELKEAQDYLLSHTVSNGEIEKVVIKETIQQKLKEYNDRMKKKGVTAIYSNVLSEELKSSCNVDDKSKQTTLAYISHFELDHILKEYSAEAKKEFMDNAYVMYAAYYDERNIYYNTVDYMKAYFGDRKKGIEPNQKAVLGIDIGGLLVNSLKTVRNEMKKLAKKYKEKGDLAESERYNSMQEVAKCVNNSIYGVMVSIFYEIGNPIISNFITSAARCVVYLLEKRLFITQTITDGGVFNINRCVHPRKNLKKIVNQTLVNLDERIKENGRDYCRNKNIQLAPVSDFTKADFERDEFGRIAGGREIKYKKIDYSYVLDKSKKEYVLHLYFEGVNKEDSIELDYQKAEQYVNDVCMRFIEHYYCDLDIIKTNVFKLEMKGFVTDCYIHGKSDYMIASILKSFSVDGTKLGEYSHMNHLKPKVRGYKKVKALIDYLLRMANPSKVERIRPVVIETWLKPGKKNEYKKYMGNNDFQWGDFVKEVKQYKEFSMGQFKFYSYSQRESFKRFVSKQNDKHGQSLEFLYSYTEEVNGEPKFYTNVELMNEEIQKWITTGKKLESFLKFKGVNSFENHVKDVKSLQNEDYQKFRYYIEHPYFEDLKSMRFFNTEDIALKFIEDYYTENELNEFGMDDLDSYIDESEYLSQSN